MATYLPPSDRAGGDDSYLIGRGPAWFAFAMTLALSTPDAGHPVRGSITCP